MKDMDRYRGVSKTTKIGVNTRGQTAHERNLVAKFCEGCPANQGTRPDGFTNCSNRVETANLVMPGDIVVDTSRVSNRCRRVGGE